MQYRRGGKVLLKAVIFDMDGVIIDSEPFQLIICLKLFKDLNINITEDEYNTFTGVSNTSMWTTLKNKYGMKETVSELVKLQTEAYINYLEANEEKPIPGVVEILEGLKNNNIKIALASSSPMEGIRLVIDKFQISDYFQAVISGENLKRGKPAPDIFLNAAKMLKVEPEYCTVIEDSNHGVNAAKAAGMKCIGFQNPNSGNQYLEEADLIVNSMEELNFNRVKML
jgi:beta-phosphoglucomutase family hydrolase